jgi:hypothetical protein
MSRHHHLIKQRQQSMLGRTNAEVGMPAESAGYWSPVQGKASSAARSSYDRSGSALS